MSVINEGLGAQDPATTILEAIAHRVDIVVGAISEDGTSLQLLEAQRAAGHIAEGLLALHSIVAMLPSHADRQSVDVDEHSVIHAETAFAAHDPRAALLPATTEEVSPPVEPLVSELVEPLPVTEASQTPEVPEREWKFNPADAAASLVARLRDIGRPLPIRELDDILTGGKPTTKETRLAHLRAVQKLVRNDSDLGVVIVSTGQRAGMRYFLSEVSANPESMAEGDPDGLMLASAHDAQVDDASPDTQIEAFEGAVLDGEESLNLPDRQLIPDASSTSTEDSRDTMQLNPSVTSNSIPEGFLPITEQGLGYVTEDGQKVFYLRDRELLLRSPAAYAVLDIFAQSSKKSFLYGELVELFKAAGQDPREINTAASRLSLLLSADGFYDRRTVVDGKKVRTIGFETMEERAAFLPVTPATIRRSM